MNTPMRFRSARLRRSLTVVVRSPLKLETTSSTSPSEMSPPGTAKAKYLENVATSHTLRSACHLRVLPKIPVPFKAHDTAGNKTRSIPSANGRLLSSARSIIVRIRRSAAARSCSEPLDAPVRISLASSSAANTEGTNTRNASMPIRSTGFTLKDSPSRCRPTMNSRVETNRLASRGVAK